MRHSAAVRTGFSIIDWWVGELRESLEDVRAYLLPRWGRHLAVFVSPTHLRIADGASVSEPIELSLSELSAENLPAPPAMAGIASINGRRAHVIFEPEFAFVQSLRLPLRVLPHLESVIELQKTKLLPMDPALLLSDYELAAVGQQEGTVDVELATIRRADVAAVEGLLRAWGLRLGAVHLGALQDSRQRFKFGTTAASYSMTRAHFRFVVSAAVLTLGLIGVFVVQSVRAERTLDRALTDTSTAAAAVLQQRQELIDRLETLSYISESERQVSAAAVLADTTAHLNRDGWLTTFEFKGGELRLVGVASDPGALIKELANSSLIHDMELRSSASTVNGSGKERFEIIAKVKATPK